MNLTGIPQPRQRRRRGAVAPTAAGRAVIYLRVSTEEQAQDTENGGSLASQEERCRALCGARGLDVAEVFTDPGVSGGTLSRPGLEALRACVSAGEAEVVVVYAIDRLSRRQADTLALLEEFERHGAGLMAASQPFDTASPAGRAMLGMLAVFAELQRSEIRSRTKAGLDAKRARGERVSRLPLGLERDGKGFRRDPATWPIVERILRESDAGQSCQAVADGLNKDVVPTATALRGQARGLVNGPGKWHAATVASLRQNEAIRKAAISD
jgi:site-specific DNA recombinase